jgi:hypothetical protein
MASNDDKARDMGRLEGQFHTFSEQSAADRARIWEHIHREQATIIDKLDAQHKERLLAFSEMQRSTKSDIENAKEALEQRLVRLENEISTYKTIIKTLKFIFYAAITVAAFKFGDIKTLWKEIFGA